MKNAFLLIVTFIILLNYLANAQNDPYDFLTIVIEKTDGEIEKVIYYPEGSTHKVFDKKDKPAKPKSINSNAFTYFGNLKLTIFPEYRKEKPDYFEINNQKLTIFTTAKAAYDAGFGADWNGDSSNQSKNFTTKENQYHYCDSHDVTAKKELMESKTNPGKYNMRLTFSNGIMFTYEDGKAKAILEDVNLKIEGKYVVESKLGVARISFNPENGVAWWVFEPFRKN